MKIVCIYVEQWVWTGGPRAKMSKKTCFPAFLFVRLKVMVFWHLPTGPSGLGVGLARLPMLGGNFWLPGGARGITKFHEKSRNSNAKHCPTKSFAWTEIKPDIHQVIWKVMWRNQGNRMHLCWDWNFGENHRTAQTMFWSTSGKWLADQDFFTPQAPHEPGREDVTKIKANGHRLPLQRAPRS